ncbi:MAG: D-aminoacylase [Myxococcaceae bacterium]|nr:D-aminoacylase [Myxococcaceae bacterium]
MAPGLLLAALAAADFDLVISNGRVVDGTGAPWFSADVGIKGDRITAVGDLKQRSATRRIDVKGKMVAPGFIDLLGQSELYVLVDNRVESKIRQGITTEISGEGVSVAPLDDRLIAEQRDWLAAKKLTIDWRDLDGYFRRFERSKSAINLGLFIGAGNVRGVVLGLDDVQPTPEQLTQMEQLVDTAMKQGALGVSTALIYPHGSYAKTPELVALAKVAARHGGLYATHLRGEDERFPSAFAEAVSIGREAGLPVEVWHLKVAEKKQWGRMKELVALVDQARKSGVDVSANVYPYTAAQNSLSASVPEWAQAGGVDAMIARFKDPAQRARIVKELTETGALARETPEGILLVSFVNPALKPYAGMKLSEVAKAMKKPAAEALLDLVEQDRGGTTAVRFWMSDDDVKLALAQPWASFCTDAPGQAIDGPFAGEKIHPRAFGGAARLLGYWAKQQGVFGLEEAVRHMTSLPARRMRLFDRGLIRPGMAADVTVFDPETIADTATYEEPLRYATGVDTVIVNGRVVLDAGKLTAERPGRALRRAK